MSEAQIAEHASYVADETKIAAYERALQLVVRPESVVLDLGAGTGILGLLAARAGARHVYSVDRGSIISTAEAIARASGLADRMTFIRESSTRLRLDRPADVAVCDQIGGLVYDAGVLDFFADARARLLHPVSVLVPGSFDLLAAPVAATAWDDKVGLWARHPAGLDMGPMFELATNTEFRVDIPAEQFLGQPAAWAEGVVADSVQPICGGVELRIERPGSINAIAGMFRAWLAPGVELTNCPVLPNRFKRWQNLYPLPAPVPVGEGDRVTVRFDVRPRTYLATWSVEVARAGAEPVRSRGSTILGMFLTPTDVSVTSGRAVPSGSEALNADRFIMAQVDGRRSIADIIEATWESHGSAFASRAELKGRVESLLWRHLRPEQPWSTSSTA